MKVADYTTAISNSLQGQPLALKMMRDYGHSLALGKEILETDSFCCQALICVLIARSSLFARSLQRTGSTLSRASSQCEATLLSRAHGKGFGVQHNMPATAGRGLLSSKLPWGALLGLDGPC